MSQVVLEFFVKKREVQAVSSYARQHGYGAACFLTAFIILTFTSGRSEGRLPQALAGVGGKAQGVAEEKTLPVAVMNGDVAENIETPTDVRLFVASHPQGDLTPLWAALGINTVNVSEHQQLDPGTFRFLTDCSLCEAENFHYELDGEPGLEVIVRVHDKLREASRYLIFKEVDKPVGKWKLLGHVDHMLNKYRMSEHSFVACGGRTLLITTGQGASGSGVALYFSRAFLVRPEGLQELLSFVTDGHQSGFSEAPSRSFSAGLLSCEVSGDLATIEIQFSAKYFIADPSHEQVGLHLLTKTQRATFTRWLGNAEPSLDPKRSEITEREIEDVHSIDSLTSEAFLVYNFDFLAKLARGPSSPERDWLERFLKSCEPTNERKRLQRLLNS